MPASWLIASTKGERGNLYNFRNMLQQQVGGIENKRISRFGRNRFLIHAKSSVQAAMICNLIIEPDGMLKEIMPHYSFSYVKGVLFNQDLYELPEEEILNMCPSNVWKIYKVPKSYMIILTFHNDVLPDYIYIEKIQILEYMVL